MAQGKKVSMEGLQSIERAVLRGDYHEARRRLTLKVARMMDASESARDVKALAVTLAPLIESMAEEGREEERRRDAQDTPLARVLSMAGSVDE